MPQPRDITNSIYRSKRLKSTQSVQKPSGEISGQDGPVYRLRKMRFSTFSFAVALMVSIAVVGQFALMSLFRWL